MTYRLQTRMMIHCPTCGNTVGFVAKSTPDGHGVLFCPICSEPVNVPDGQRDEARALVRQAGGVKVLPDGKNAVPVGATLRKICDVDLTRGGIRP